MRRVFFTALGIIILLGCKKDLPDPPGKTTLVEPAKNEECSPVASSSGTENRIRFNWQSGGHTDSYELHITNLITGVSAQRNSNGTTETVPLEKGTPFSWFVISKNAQTTDRVLSETWAFYSPGAQTDHVPFPAEIISPEPGATVFKDLNNEIELKWSGTDIDGDIASYEIYFSDQTPPNVLVANPDATAMSLKVTAVSGTVYYWKVITEDTAGNLSHTGILDFKVF